MTNDNAWVSLLLWKLISAPSWPVCQPFYLLHLFLFICVFVCCNSSEVKRPVCMWNQLFMFWFSLVAVCFSATWIVACTFSSGTHEHRWKWKCFQRSRISDVQHKRKNNMMNVSWDLHVYVWTCFIRSTEAALCILCVHVYSARKRKTLENDEHTWRGEEAGGVGWGLTPNLKSMVHIHTCVCHISCCTFRPLNG